MYAALARRQSVVYSHNDHHQAGSRDNDQPDLPQSYAYTVYDLLSNVISVMIQNGGSVCTRFSTLIFITTFGRHAQPTHTARQTENPIHHPLLLYKSD